MSKVIRILFGFAFLRKATGLEKNLRHFVVQSEVSSKPIVTLSPRLYLSASSFDWFTRLFVSVPCDLSEFWFYYTQLSENRSYVSLF